MPIIQLMILFISSIASEKSQGLAILPALSEMPHCTSASAAPNDCTGTKREKYKRKNKMATKNFLFKINILITAQQIIQLIRGGADSATEASSPGRV